MDLITSSLLSDFTKEFQLDDLPESERFEHFTAYVTVRRHYSEIFDTSDITVGEGNDLGMDAIAIIVNGVLIADTDGFDDLMSGNPDYLDVSFIFVQADRGPRSKRPSWAISHMASASSSTPARKNHETTT